MEKAAVRRNYGMAAEEAAALFLEGKGIRILERETFEVTMEKLILLRWKKKPFLLWK